MKRAGRLPGGSAFDSVYAKGTVTSGPLLVVRTHPNGTGGARWGFAVGKRMAKKAVVRNRLRRQLREAARSLRVAGGFDIVVTARPRALEVGYSELRAGLAATMRRAGLEDLA